MNSIELRQPEQQPPPSVTISPIDANDFEFFAGLVNSNEPGLQQMFRPEVRTQLEATFNAIAGGNPNIMGFTVNVQELDTTQKRGLATLRYIPGTESAAAKVLVGLGLTEESRGKNISAQVLEQLFISMPLEWSPETVEAMIYPTNERSLKFFYKAGFRGVRIEPDPTNTRYFYVMSLARSS